MLYGRCRVCGCTEHDPCYSPGAGLCSWADNGKTLCSHCADETILNNPLTVHRIVSEAEYAGCEVGDIVNQVESGEPFDSVLDIHPERLTANTEDTVTEEDVRALCVSVIRGEDKEAARQRAEDILKRLDSDGDED